MEQQKFSWNILTLMIQQILCVMDPDRDLYSNLYDWSTCDMNGCTVPTSDPER
jgi:hypothetical protein